MVVSFAPTVSDLKSDGTKIVNLYDIKTDTYRNIKVSASDADEFINSRNDKRNKCNKRGGVLGAIGTIVGGALGYKFSPAKLKAMTSAMGAFSGLIAGLLVHSITGGFEKVDRKHTEEFLAKHSENGNINTPKATISPSFKGTYPQYTDLTEKYPQEEIVDILKLVGTFDEEYYPSEYEVKLYNTGTLVINNKNQTNDTTEICKDGSVRHVGSWHNTEVAPAGSFPFLVEDAQAKISN